MMMNILADYLDFPDGTELVVAETYRQRLWRGMWDAHSCRWVDARPWVDVGGTVGPDGMCFDSDGLLYVAVYGSGQVKVVSPAGEIIRETPVGGANPTNCAIDPSETLGLVVTEAETGRLLSIQI